MSTMKIQQIWAFSYDDYVASGSFQSTVQKKASQSIMGCRTGKFGVNVCICSECGYLQVRNNSCRNRSCPNCQAVDKEIWVDKRKAEVIDSPYFHVVFTLPHELNPLLYRNQRLLYGLLHKCCAETLLELSANKKYLGATPGIIQVLHTWNQELKYHVHMHCIISGGGLTKDQRIRKSKGKFFIPVFVLRDKFKGKFLSNLKELYSNGRLVFPASCSRFESPDGWQTFISHLYDIKWCPYIKETFNGFGNAIEYLGRYANRIAISNSRIMSVTKDETTFTARGLRPGDPKRQIKIKNTEFIRRYLMHVLPKGFQKIRYYGFLNNRMKSANLKLIFRIQGKQKYKSHLAEMTMPQIMKQLFHKDICQCPACGKSSLQFLGTSRISTG